MASQLKEEVPEAQLTKEAVWGGVCVCTHVCTCPSITRNTLQEMWPGLWYTEMTLTRRYGETLDRHHSPLSMQSQDFTGLLGKVSESHLTHSPLKDKSDNLLAFNVVESQTCS